MGPHISEPIYGSVTCVRAAAALCNMVLRSSVRRVASMASSTRTCVPVSQFATVSNSNEHERTNPVNTSVLFGRRDIEIASKSLISLRMSVMDDMAVGRPMGLIAFITLLREV